MPADFGIIAIPLIFFSFFDILIERGMGSAIVKHNCSKSLLKLIEKQQIVLWVSYGPLIILSLFLIQEVALNYSIPLIIIFSYAASSFLKIFYFFSEAKLISEGKYILTEFLSFILTIFIYIGLIYSIPFLAIDGFYFLCILAVVYPLAYSMGLQILLKLQDFEYQETSIETLNNFSFSSLRSAFLESIGSRLDELTIAFILNPSILGLYSKIKELAVMIGAFVSKIICRPWFYISSKIDSYLSIYIWLGSLILSIVFFIFAHGIIQDALFVMIRILGENWSEMNEYVDLISLIIYLYSAIAFTRYTLLGINQPHKQLTVDKISFVTRLALYSLLIVLSVNIFMFNIQNILYLEVCLFSLMIIMQFFIMLKILIYRKAAN